MEKWSLSSLHGNASVRESLRSFVYLCNNNPILAYEIEIYFIVVRGHGVVSFDRFVADRGVDSRHR